MDDPRIAVLTEQVRQLREEAREARLQTGALAESVRQSVSDSAVLTERTERLQRDVGALQGKFESQAAVARTNTVEISKRGAWLAGAWAVVATGMSIAALVAKIMG